MSSTILHKYSRINIFIVLLTRAARDRQIWLAIDETKTLSTIYILFSNHDTSNLSNLSNPNVNSSLASQRKCDNVFSYPESDHIFSHLLGTYLVYILFLLVCGNHPLTSKRGRCSNLLSIDSRLNPIDLSTNISPPNPEQGYRTKFEILLEEVFPNSIE